MAKPEQEAVGEPATWGSFCPIREGLGSKLLVSLGPRHQAMLLRLMRTRLQGTQVNLGVWLEKVLFFWWGLSDKQLPRTLWRWDWFHVYPEFYHIVTNSPEIISSQFNFREWAEYSPRLPSASFTFPWKPLFYFPCLSLHVSNGSLNWWIYDAVIKSVVSRGRLPGFDSWFSPSNVDTLGKLFNVCISFLTCKMRIKMIPSS